VLLITPTYAPVVGGLEVMVEELAKGLLNRGHEVTVVTGRSHKSLSTKDAIDGVPVYRYRLDLGWQSLRAVGGSIRNVFRGLLPLVTLCRRIRPDVINLHFVGGGHAIFAVVATRLLRIPLVSSIHGADVEWTERTPADYHLSAPLAIRYSAALTANSDYMAAIAGRVGKTQTSFVVIRNGVHVESMSGSEFISARNSDFAFAAGRFVFKKGFDILVEATAHVAAKVPSFNLKIAGDGPEFDRCVQLADDLGLSAKIQFLGLLPHEQVQRLMKECKFFVLPSRQEPLGLVNYEAMASGKAVVATRVGGVPEIIRDGYNGILVEPENAAALATGIMKLWNSPHLSDQMGSRGRAQVEKQYTWEQCVDKFEEVYRSVVKQ